jgi:hypothetical protein
VGAAISAVQVRYPDGRGILRDVLAEATRRGFAIDVATQTLGPRAEPGGRDHDRSRPGRPLVQVTLHVHGRQPVTELAAALSELEDVAGDPRHRRERRRRISPKPLIFGLITPRSPCVHLGVGGESPDLGSFLATAVCCRGDDRDGSPAG